MQTEQFNILVGSEKRSFKVPEGRLTMHSSVFERMCSAPFREAKQRLIKLPEDDPSVFADFFDWMHSSKPQVDFSKGTEAIYALAIFAEKYQICHLKNQLADLILRNWEQHKPNPKTLDQVYSGVPERALLRQLCSGILERTTNLSNHYIFYRRENAQDLYQEYGQVFASHPDLGRDFFLWVTRPSINTTSVQSDNACAFHDHSNIPNRSKSQNIFCPYSDSFVASPAAVRRASKRHKQNPWILPQLSNNRGGYLSDVSYDTTLLSFGIPVI